MVKTHKVKKLALNLQLPTVQILTNDVQVLILCLSYSITTVLYYSLLGSLHGGLEKGPSIECDVRHDPSFLLSFVEMT